METKEVIDRKIEELEQKLSEVQGTPTEVYSRIVGYYRSVRNWNKGKGQEFTERVTFNRVDPKPVKPLVEPASEEKQPEETTENSELFAEGIDKILYFYRTTCPNCPPVKEYLDHTERQYTSINVDSKEGLTEAARYEVLSAPTVLALDIFGNVQGTAQNTLQLENILPVEAEAVNR